jgi:hypothetical protein
MLTWVLVTPGSAGEFLDGLDSSPVLGFIVVVGELVVKLNNDRVRRYMAKHATRPASVGLLDVLPATQQSHVRLVADSLERDIIRFRRQLASPLTSWDQQGHETVEANVALSFALKAVAEFLPADLQPLIAQFIDLRGQLVLRTFEEG